MINSSAAQPLTDAASVLRYIASAGYPVPTRELVDRFGMREAGDALCALKHAHPPEVVYLASTADVTKAGWVATGTTY